MDPAVPGDRRYDVAVVGLGPVGAVAALLLAAEGLSVAAIEPSETPYDKPRAIAIDHESLRILQAVGVADDLVPHLGAYRASQYVSAKGEVLRRILPAAEPHLLSWPSYNTFIQPELERLLRAALSAHPLIDLHYGARFTGLRQSADHVRLTLDAMPGVIEARYVIGCDGAWSPVRTAVGIALEDLQFDEPWLVVDVLVDDDSNLPPDTTQFCDPARPSTLVHGPGALRRWEIMLLQDEDPAEMVKEEAIWPLLGRWLQPGQGRIWRAAAYRFHALVAQRWRDGRVFIAGDAAHQTPPFMAQGLNQGFRDAGNLCWKIAQVVARGADTALLDSYDAERRPNAQAVIALTKTFGRLICERDPAAAEVRDATMLMEVAQGRGEMIRQDLLPPLRGGMMVSAGDDPELAVAAGLMFPQPWITTDNEVRRMDDVAMGGFLLVVSGTPADGAWRDAAGASGIAILSLDDASVGGDILAAGDRNQLVRQWMARQGLASVLVRPDHIVFGGASNAGREGALVERLQRALKAVPAP